MGPVRVGCSGWGYDDWVGPFYPPGTPPGEFLERYARVFDLAEVDSSFYRSPSPFLTRRWASSVPTDFRFTLKVPRAVTHDASESSLPGAIDAFAKALEPMQAAGKLAAVVFQFPPSFKRAGGAERLETILSTFPPGIPRVVELRHGSWWVPETRELLERHRAGLVWPVAPGIRPPFWVTSELVYARFLGDRALTTFDRIQRDHRDEMVTMWQHFQDEGLSAREIYALVNNHFMGFGPGTVQVLREVLGLPPLDLSRARTMPGQRQLAT